MMAYTLTSEDSAQERSSWVSSAAGTYGDFAVTDAIALGESLPPNYHNTNTLRALKAVKAVQSMVWA